MSETKKTIEIVASYSGTVNTGNYNNESPFFSIKEVFEVDENWSDADLNTRQTELELMCYEKFQSFKEEALKPLLVEAPEIDPKCSVPQMEEIRQKAIVLIGEQGKWFQENDYQKDFRVLFNNIFKKDFDGDLQKLSFGGARHLNRQLGVLQSKLNGKTKDAKTNKKEKNEEKHSEGLGRFPSPNKDW